VGDTENLVALSEKLEGLLGVPPLLRVNGKRALNREWQHGPREDPDRWRKRLAHHHGNVGMLCGNGIAALDFDLYKPEGAMTSQLLEDAGLVPADTVRAHSGAGGLHVLVRYDPAVWRVGCGDFADIALGAGRLPGGAEWKGDGGYIVICPSIHPDTGRQYLWEDDCGPGESEIAWASDELLELIGHRLASAGETHSRGPGGWSNYNPAQLDDVSAEAVELLVAHFGAHTPILHHHHDTAYASVTRPGKRPDGSTSATIGYSRPGHIRVWSTNWEDLKSGAYTLGDLRRLAGLDTPHIEIHEVGQADFAQGHGKGSMASMWLWEGLMPAGQFVIAAGNEKLGKSTALIWVCARLTTGDLPGDYTGKPLTAAYISAEDDSLRVLVPRFDAAGADPNRYWTLTTGGVFSIDVLKALDPRPEVLVLDPISAFVTLKGAANEHGEIAVRQALAVYHELAVNEQITVIGVRHSRKGSPGDNPLDMVMGSKAWAAAARALLIFAPDREHEGRPGGLIFGRGNLAAPAAGLRYRLEQVAVRYDKAVTRPSTGEQVTEGLANLFVPEGSAEITLDEALGPKSQATERLESETFLAELLGDGEEHLLSDVLAAAEREGIAERTLHRARKKLGVAVRVEGFGKARKSWWKLTT
jgi:hypothetical protein